MALTKNQIGRYSRHLIMPEVGVKGQEKLAESKVLCIGAGGLGSPLALVSCIRRNWYYWYCRF